MIGNSRLHWGKFQGTQLLNFWDTDYLNPCQQNLNPQLPIILASVVPEQTLLWQKYPNIHQITLEDLPLKNLYPTLGIDRGLAVLGTGTTLGFPTFVIDAGTALTFTGVDQNQTLIGGAILPGFRLQFSSLAQQTSALPTVEIPQHLPSRWGNTTPESIQSGIIYTILAGIRDFIQAWLQDFPNSSIAITGGDRDFLLTHLPSYFNQLATPIIAAPEAIFWGMAAVSHRFLK